MALEKGTGARRISCSKAFGAGQRMEDVSLAACAFLEAEQAHQKKNSHYKTFNFHCTRVAKN